MCVCVCVCVCMCVKEGGEGRRQKEEKREEPDLQPLFGIVFPFGLKGLQRLCKAAEEEVLAHGLVHSARSGSHCEEER